MSPLVMSARLQSQKVFVTIYTSPLGDIKKLGVDIKQNQ